jgi:catechol 2,3-dioxygenase-like lactoylglutathione lyase family enzyme
VRRLAGRHVALVDSEPTKIPRGADDVLGNHPIHPVLLSTDLSKTRSFYHDKLGLSILIEREDEAIEFRCGGGTKLVITKSTTGTADSQSQLGWEVDDLRAELTELRNRGVTVEDYDLPGFKTEDGVADFGFAWMAFIIDPSKNALAIIEHKR